MKLMKLNWNFLRGLGGGGGWWGLAERCKTKKQAVGKGGGYGYFLELHISREMFNIPFKCRTLQRGIRMFISFLEILVMFDVG